MLSKVGRYMSFRIILTVKVNKNLLKIKFKNYYIFNVK